MMSSSDEGPWAASLPAAGNDPGASAQLAALPGARLVEVVRSGSISEYEPAGGTLAWTYGWNGDPRASCAGSTWLLTGGRAVGSYGSCNSTAPVDPPRTDTVLVGGTLTAMRAGWDCKRYGTLCATYSGETNVTVSVLRYYPEIRRDIEPDGQYAYRIETPGWRSDVPYNYIKWGVIRNGVDHDISWWCNNYDNQVNVCPNNNPNDTGLLYVMLVVNGRQMTLTRSLDGGGDITASADSSEVWPNSLVTFTVQGSPDQVAGHTVDIYRIKWTWVSGTQSTHVASCDNLRICQYRPSAPGTMQVEGDYNGNGLRTDDVEVEIRRHGLELQADPNPVMQGSPITYFVTVTGDSAAQAVVSNFRWEWTPDDLLTSPPPSCGSSPWVCATLQNHSGTMKVTATVDGADTSATTRVDVWCLLNEYPLDDPRVRKLMDDAWRSSGPSLPSGQRRERMGHVWRDYGTGDLITELRVRNSTGTEGGVSYRADTPCSTDPTALDRGHRLLSMHPHPFVLGDPVPWQDCGIDPPDPGYQWTTGRGPSDDDFESARQREVPGLAFDRDAIYLYPHNVPQSDILDEVLPDGTVKRTFKNKDLHAKTWQRKRTGCVIFRT